ncbi:MAG: choice-of-anchor Q domain-containing protein, partial [Phycisphaerales bacterium]
MKNAILLSLALLSVAAAPALAETRLVPSNYRTIQQAIQGSSNGDVVIVEPGTYFETINFLGKNIVLTSTDPDDPDIVATTTIDGDGEGSVVTFENGETSEAVLTGFTISGGYGTVDPAFGEEIPWGGGIYCKKASPTIRNNVITDNHCPMTIVGQTFIQGYGGAIACVESEAVITHNIIKGNSTFAGAGIMTYPFSDPTTGAAVIRHPMISNNLIYDNSAYVGGGVILLYAGHLINNTVVGNDASNDIDGQTGFAGNVYTASDPELDQCVIVNNIICNAKSGGGILSAGAGEDLIAFNDVWNNAPDNYATQDPQTGEEIYGGPADRTGRDGNISLDPLFVDPQVNDYHLQLDSPCVNAGDPDFVPEPDETDIDGDPRVYGMRVDMGADEYIGYVKPVAHAGPDQHVAELQLITLDASGSFVYDPCSALMYEWDQLAGPAVELSNPTSMNPTFMPEFEGEYRFELVVIDGMYMSQPDEVLILVGNNPPVADAGPNRVVPVESRVNLDGTGSHDPDPMDELAYAWTQLEGPQVILQDADTARPFFDCNEGGSYVFQLVVNDGFVDSEPSVVKVTTAAVTMNQLYLDVGYVTTNYFHYPDVSGSTVVYCVGPFDDYSWNIRSKSLETEVVDEEFIGGGIDTQPRIDGDIVVWAGGPFSPDFRGPECIGIFVRNITTGAEETLRRHSNTQSYSHPAVSANKVVWLEHLDINKYIESDWRDTPYSISGADITDLDQPVYFTIATNVGRRDPYPYQTYTDDYDDVIDISEDIVVWEADGDIYGADISDMDNIKLFTICSDPARQYDPAISGNLVVWTDERSDGGDIYGADISDTENIRELAIVRVSGNQQQPAIDGCLIAYVDGGTYGQIKACCLTKQDGVIEITLSGFPFGAGPAIDGDTVIWQTSTDGPVQGISLEVSYSAADGPVENLTTGGKYDYIQHAIVSASAGDRIVVDEGIYHESINFKGKN